MLAEKKGKEIVKKALAHAKKFGATECEVVLWDGREELTRFANNEIHQSVSLNDSMLHVRLILGSKIGVSRINRFDDLSIQEAVSAAYELSKLQKADPHFKSLPKKSTYAVPSGLSGNKKHIGAIGRARAIKTLIEQAKTDDLSASGAFSESEGVTIVANSHGIYAYHHGVSASLTTVMTGEKGSGYASQYTQGGEEINPKVIAQTGVQKATHGKVLEITPGEYEVILEPPAVAELMDFYSWLGPNARIYHEDVSFYQGNIGKKVFHELLSLTDDPTHKAGYPMPFDMEGVAKAPLSLVKNGVLTGIAYDSYHAGKHGEINTGHALLAPNTWGPIPTHIVIDPGTSTVPAMIKKVKKGLLITRFWYTRVIHHKKLVLTGMTRDGTFYIENGKILGRVLNLRYTESILTALSDIRGVGKELSLQGSEGSPSLVPALHLGRFRFTGVTKHG